MSRPPENIAIQQAQYRRSASVRSAMLRAGARGESRIAAGLSQSLRNKMTSVYGEDDATTKVSMLLRLMGGGKSAEWIDRMFAKDINDEIEREEEKGGKRRKFNTQDREEIKKAHFRYWKANHKKKNLGSWVQYWSHVEKEVTNSADSDGKPVVVVANGGKGSLVSVNRRLAFIHKDVRDIKMMLMPKTVSINATSGKQRTVQFNPLAPQADQFQEVTPKGALTYKKLSAADKTNASRRAALETAKIVLKVMETDAERKKRSYKWKDKKEGYATEDPLVSINKRLGRIEDQLEGKDEKKGWLYRLGFMLGAFWNRIRKIISPILTIVRGIWTVFKPLIKGVFNIVRGIWTVFKPMIRGMWNIIRALGSGVGRLMSMFGLSVPAALGGAAAAATTGAMAYALDKGIKQSADTAIDKITSDVTKQQERGGFKPEDSYVAYKQAIDKSLENKSEEQKAYIKQQLTQSEGLSDLERRMAARYFAEKEGVKSSGPTSRGGTRGRAEAIPSEQLDTDTVDTNYSTPPPPPQTGKLKASTYESRLKQLGDVIASGESKGDYNIFNKGTVGKNKGKIGREDLSNMTIAEYLRRGSLGKDDPQKMFAVGKYQIIPDTMRNIVSALGLNPNTTTLSPDVQDRMFKYLVESKPAVRKYLEGKSNDEKAAMLALAKEWASVGVPEDTYRNGQLIKAGESYYSGVGGNRAHTSPEQIAAAVRPSGASMDSQARALQASNAGAPAVTVVGPTVNNTNVSQTVPKRKVDRADVLSNDNALVRTVMKDSSHPVNI